MTISYSPDSGGAFVGLDKILKTRIQGTAMGFGAKLTDKTDTDFSEVSPDELVRYGLIPEFVGRFTSIVCLHGLTKEQLISILTKVKHNYIEQYQWLFDQDGVELQFDEDSLDTIADRTLKTKTGARGLHTELERVLLPHMFNITRYRDEGIVHVIITEDLVNNPKELKDSHDKTERKVGASSR